mmetsp:Transcript_72376/g.204559  ORF Transcript_72376/g.204559 Transcript_72376/m.204559 type:complete len:203 (-) Transcript_72376:344-952(-)
MKRDAASSSSSSASFSASSAHLCFRSASSRSRSCKCLAFSAFTLAFSAAALSRSSASARCLSASSRSSVARRCFSSWISPWCAARHAAHFAALTGRWMKSVGMIVLDNLGSPRGLSGSSRSLWRNSARMASFLACVSSPVWYPWRPRVQPAMYSSSRSLPKTGLLSKAFARSCQWKYWNPVTRTRRPRATAQSGVLGWYAAR